MLLRQADFEKKKERIGVVGLGYVGLPLAALFARKYDVLGFDINVTRVQELKENLDRTREMDSQTLKDVGIEFTDDGKKAVSLQAHRCNGAHAYR